MTEPNQPRRLRRIHADCRDHPGATTGKSLTEIYQQSIDAHIGGPADIVELSAWDITADRAGVVIHA